MILRLAPPLVALLTVACADRLAAKSVPAEKVAPAAVDPVVRDPITVEDDAAPTLGEARIKSGGVELLGAVYSPAGRGPHPTVILLHGFPGNERNGDLAHALRRAGNVVVWFHYRGAWGTAGDFSFVSALADVSAAIDHVRQPEFMKKHGSSPDAIALVGHSVGGFLALSTAASRKEARCAVSMAGANLGAVGGIAATGSIQRGLVEVAFRTPPGGPIRVREGESLVEELIKNREAFDLRTIASKLADRPVLLIAGSRDTVAPRWQHHEPVVTALKEAKAAKATFHELDTDHVFGSKRIALAHLITSWLRERCFASNP